MPDLSGYSLGRYHILKPLGEGGMATVYKAFDTRLKNEMAIQDIRTERLPQSAVGRIFKRFEQEAKALACLTHPTILKVIGYDGLEGMVTGIRLNNVNIRLASAAIRANS
jgi:eukaryotic-like serine/threonine-protein kinase